MVRRRGNDPSGRADRAGVPAASQAAPSVAGAGQAGSAETCQGVQWSLWAGVGPSIGLYPFDAYRWLLDGVPIAGQSGESYTPTGAEVGHQLRLPDRRDLSAAAARHPSERDQRRDHSTDVTVAVDVASSASSASSASTASTAGRAGAVGAAGLAAHVHADRPPRQRSLRGAHARRPPRRRCTRRVALDVSYTLTPRRP